MSRDVGRVPATIEGWWPESTYMKKKLLHILCQSGHPARCQRPMQQGDPKLSVPLLGTKLELMHVYLHRSIFFCCGIYYTRALRVPVTITTGYCSHLTLPFSTEHRKFRSRPDAMVGWARIVPGPQDGASQSSHSLVKTMPS